MSQQPRDLTTDVKALFTHYGCRVGFAKDPTTGEIRGQDPRASLKPGDPEGSKDADRFYATLKGLQNQGVLKWEMRSGQNQIALTEVDPRRVQNLLSQIAVKHTNKFKF